MSKWNSIVISLLCGKYQSDNNKDTIMYRTFGNHDSLIISPVDGETATDVLTEMWNKTNTFSENINPGESIHNLFGVAKSGDCEEFWERKSRYLFVSEIQLNYKRGTGFENQLSSFENELETLLLEYKLKENKDFVFYYSLDCGDIILFLRTDEYLYGADIINQITIKSQYKHYSYSVCGMDIGLILTDDSYNEIIPKVVICSVFSDATYYKKWFDNFISEYPSELVFDNNDNIQKKVFEFSPKDEFVHLARIGNEDVCVNIYNCDLRHFVEMLICKTGVFSHENELVNTTFSRLRIQLDSKFSDILSPNERSATKGTSLISCLENKWKTKLSGNVNPFVYKALVEVLVAVENLEIQEFAVDIQDCIRNVFPLFVEKIETFNFSGNPFDEEKFDRCYSIEDFDKDLILFTTGLMSIANGAMHADKLFINVPGFNAVLCDVPAKLLIYYTAYIQKMVDVLNDTENFNYRFLLCPDLYLNIEVTSLFNYKNTDSQLLKARIPIRKLFNPQILLMELSHEVAHFVDTNIRSRKERVEFLAEAISFVLADKLLRPIVFENNVDLKPEIEIIKQFLPKGRVNIEDALNNEWKEIISIFKQALLKDIDYDNTEFLYLKTLKNVFRNNLQNLLIGDFISEDPNYSFLDSIYDVIVNEEQLDEYENVVLLSEVIERHINQIILNEYRMVIERTCDLFYESFADLIMLYITEDPLHYLSNIFEIEKNKVIKYNNTNKYPWDECYINEMRFERIISVFMALDYNLSNIGSEDSDFSSFIDALKRYSDKNNYDMRAFPFGEIQITTQYLKLCLNKLKEKGAEIECLRDLYKVSTLPNSVANCIKLFRECAFSFRDGLLRF